MPILEMIPDELAKLQGRALAEPGAPRGLTFAFERPGNISFFALTYTLGALDLKGLEVMGSQLLFLEHSFGTMISRASRQILKEGYLTRQCKTMHIFTFGN